MKRAIFFDIDGTLLDGSQGIFNMSAGTRNQIRRLQHDGDFVFLASGRPFAFLYEDLLQFGFDGFILMNGACIRLRDKAIYKQPLSKDYVDEVCRICAKNNIEYILEAIDTIYDTYNKNGKIRRINVNIAATTVENYRRLNEKGIGTYILFQETYDEEIYKKVHPKCLKGNYEYHTTSFEALCYFFL